VHIRNPLRFSARLPARVVIAAAAFVLASFVPTAHAASGAPERASGAPEPASEADTGNMFGFTSGSDMGDAGEREAEVEAIGRFGKIAGRYAAAGATLGVNYIPWANVQVGAKVGTAGFNMARVPGLDDNHDVAVAGAGFSLKYRLLDRAHAPFGLTLGIGPSWGRVDPTSGAPVDYYGVSVSLAADKELVADRLYGAVNFIYEPGATRWRSSGEWERDAGLGVSAALAGQVRPGTFVGAELRYLRVYDGIALGTLVGDALFLGPTLSIFGKGWNLMLAWSVQVSGRGTDVSCSRDLEDFERHQVRLRFGMPF
jgi:hypothetical protein